MYLRPLALGRPRIVVVDQDRPTLAQLCGLLQSKGYIALGAGAPVAASQMVQHQRVDLVLTAIAFPEEERRAWAATLSRLDVPVPVVAMCEASGGVHALDLFDTANEFGAAAVLRRPFTASVLLQTIADLLPSSPTCDTAGEQPPASTDWPALIDGSTAIH
jgi:CheY-like chemotaxis protein